MDQWRKNVENNRKQNEWEEQEAIAEKSQEKSKDEKCNPGHAGKREEKHDGEKRKTTEGDESAKATFREEEEVESAKDNHSKEVEAVDVGVAKGAKNAEDGHVFIEETDVEYELVQTKGYRENAGKKEGLEEVFEITGGLDGGVSEESERKKIKETEKFLEGGFGIEGVEERGDAPEKNNKEWEKKRKRWESFAF